MKNKLGLIYCFSVCIVFILFGALMALQHNYPTGAKTALCTGMLHGLIGVFLIFRNKKIAS